MATRAQRSAASQEQRTEQQIVVRQVTHIQASWTERERGEAGEFTLQLILDQGAAEYVLRPEDDDLELILRLFKMSDNAYFDMERKVLMFGTLALK
jgi:hypothetical protein